MTCCASKAYSPRQAEQSSKQTVPKPISAFRSRVQRPSPAALRTARHTPLRCWCTGYRLKSAPEGGVKRGPPHPRGRRGGRGERGGGRGGRRTLAWDTGGGKSLHTAAMLLQSASTSPPKPPAPWGAAPRATTSAPPSLAHACVWHACSVRTDPHRQRGRKAAGKFKQVQIQHPHVVHSTAATATATEQARQTDRQTVAQTHLAVQVSVKHGSRVLHRWAGLLAARCVVRAAALDQAPRVGLAAGVGADALFGWAG